MIEGKGWMGGKKYVFFVGDGFIRPGQTRLLPRRRRVSERALGALERRSPAAMTGRRCVERQCRDSSPRHAANSFVADEAVRDERYGAREAVELLAVCLVPLRHHGARRTASWRTRRCAMKDTELEKL